MIELAAWSRNPWSIFDELDTLQEGMNRLLADRTGAGFLRRRATGYPPMNVWSSKDGLVVDVELPGVNPRELELSVIGDELTIKGKVNVSVAGTEVAYLRRERPSGEFSRVLKLPFRAEVAAVKANYRNGVLRLHVPRAQEEKPRSITIDAA